MMFSAYAKLRAGINGAVVLDSEDTDVYVQATYLSQQLPGDLLIKRKHVFINCRDMLPEVSQIIISLHVINGSNHTSGFYGHGKKVMDRVISDPEARKLLERIGESIDLEDSIRANMKTFVLSCIYGGRADATCGQARASKWQKKEEEYDPPPT